MIRIFIALILILINSAPNLLAGSKSKLDNQISNILSRIPLDTKTGILIYNPLTQDTIFSQNIFSPMIPASVTKIFTTATALSIMGKDYRLSTILFTDDPNIKDGSINGNLYLKGFGNSTLSTEDILHFIYKLKNLGVKEITGNIIGDDSYFDNIYFREDWIPDESANVKLPPISALVLDRNKTVVKRKRGRRTIYVTENFKNPPLNIAQQFKKLIEENDITVKGLAKAGITPNNVFEIAEASIAITDLISMINKHSDNFLAECLFKSVGAFYSGQQGNSFYSQQAIQEFIKENNIYSVNTEIVDGSGISRFDQVTVASVNGVLETMYFDLKNFESFYNSLSYAAIDGTLRNRLSDLPAGFSFRGKTGTLNSVIALTGYLMSDDKDELIVTIMFEFTRGSWNFYRDIQDEIIKVLAEWKKESSDY
ncbi:D-alanyl-D-alanine carboxypeptidase [Ignavibacterium album JCM 16511]|uniref:D-alanyl-D-alanine carboxypeptidase n=1 Tax=Ignavibacterium album (strain DSM 19864 / JCM 16511 / NBRC 101810 / Mat9-16) TaxID=945713 RepID=I0ALY9_IGNAJ|nr:D-alanyl-D-alanine carboxypeptidase [Ignavibacterium album]AFH49996.1 D-alanyl-D-alanine carboxypeptidase [Ignavibacterium album JCM 16511]